MKKLWVYFLFLFLHLSAHARTMMAEDYYITAFNEMSDMLAGRDSLSIKRAVYFAEWAYYEGKLDYKTDFCDEIDRITSMGHKTKRVKRDGSVNDENRLISVR